VPINVDRTDPENRPFKHPDPIAWTEQNRVTILRALYTVLLGALRSEEKEYKGRFKTWSRLVGSPVEHAAKVLTMAEQVLPEEQRRVELVDFGTLLLDQEEGDQETVSVASFLQILGNIWPEGKPFTASALHDYIKKQQGIFPTPGQEDTEDMKNSKALKDFLYANKNDGERLNPISIGIKLKTNSDNPVRIGDKVLSLKHRKGSPASYVITRL
jgi:hypothetical protein